MEPRNILTAIRAQRSLSFYLYSLRGTEMCGHTCFYGSTGDLSIPPCSHKMSPKEWGEDFIAAMKLGQGIEFPGVKHRQPFLEAKFAFLFLHRCLALALGLTADRPGPLCQLK